MRILITRPEIDAAPLAKALEARGHVAVIMPLLDIRFRDFGINPSCYRGVLATSANGVRALERCNSFENIKTLPLYAVGPASAAEARRAGFAHVETAGGDVVRLGEHVRTHLEAEGAPLLHVSGKAAAGDLQGLLGGFGFRVERIIGYEAKKARGFTPQVLQMLQEGDINAVLLYSPRTAVIFSDLVRQSGLDEALGHVRFFCLSDAVGAKLARISAKAVLVAQSPDQDALLDLVEQCSQDR
jgi:uroporphyrinogen-III synthase